MQPDDQSALLEQLRDVALPQAPGLWPPAPGWWLLAALFVALALALAAWRLRWLQRWHSAREHRRAARVTWRAVALAEHERLAALPQENAAQRAQLLAELSVLMRRVALATGERQQAAGLIDASWLAQLDRIDGDAGNYSRGVGRLLTRHPYMRPEALAEASIGELLALTQATIRRADPAAAGAVGC